MKCFNKVVIDKIGFDKEGFEFVWTTKIIHQFDLNDKLVLLCQYNKKTSYIQKKTIKEALGDSSLYRDFLLSQLV